jgi:hypothetical protein
MRRLVFVALIALIALIGAAPAPGFAQTAASPPAAAQAKPPATATAAPVTPAVPAAPAAESTGVAAAIAKMDDTTRVLAIGLGAVSGMVLFTAISSNMITSAALASLGQGIVVFTGTLVGGLLGNWLYARDIH